MEIFLLRGEPGLEGKKNLFFESHLIRLEIYSEICLQNFRVKFQIVSQIFGVGEFEIYTINFWKKL